MARACRENHCALLGGETAEMPGFYADGEYDIAGFIVGVVERARLITGSSIKPGDVLIGVPSTGLHTNGYSLARRIAFDHLQLDVDSFVPELSRPIGEALLEPHRSVSGAREASPRRPDRSRGWLISPAVASPRTFPASCPKAWPRWSARRRGVFRRVFTWLQESGRVPTSDMMRTFNMGIGLIVAVAADQADQVKSALGGSVIGEIVPGEPEVTYVQ